MSSQQSITLFVILSSVIILLLVFLVVFFTIIYNAKIKTTIDQFNREKLEQETVMLRQMLESIEVEQNRIAQDLHDDLGPLMSILKIKYNDFKAFASSDEKLYRSYVSQLEIIDLVSNKIRESCYNLSPNVLSKYGLDSALSQFVLTINSHVAFDLIGLDENISLISKTRETALFRILSELINNALKYSTSSEFKLLKTVDNDFLIYRIKYHGGIGLTNESFQHKLKSGSTLGLNNIKNRVLYLNASIDYQKVNNYYSVEIKTPIYEIKN